jgi:tetratricopeptide (TPR) repeat protein
MCMRILDNMSRRPRLPIVGGREKAICLVILAITIGSVSCRKATTAPSEAAPARPATEAIAQADQLYAGRADLVKVREAVVALRQAQADHPSDYDLAWRLAKYNYYLGAHSPEPSEQEKAFRDGIEAGKQAVQLQDSKADGHFWLGANYGGAAQSSVLAGLAGVDDIKGEMETVLKLDQSYQSASAYMVLGQVYLQAPKLLGGDVQKAIDYLEKGVKLGPDNALMKVTLAKAYAAAHRNADAQKQLDALTTMKVTPGYEPEYAEAVAEAKKVQEKIK